MVILGIDPGTATTGYGVVKKQGDTFQALAYGVILTSKTRTDAERLTELAKDLRQIIKKYKPAVCGVEKLFFTTNQKTVMTVSQGRGVVLLTLQELGVELVELTPLQVKNTLTGYGKADKKQMQYMIKKTLNLKTVPKPDDAADALAIAVCAGLHKHSPLAL
jgi:crossover junction endodeoxyribonuclease RuvC